MLSVLFGELQWAPAEAVCQARSLVLGALVHRTL